MSREELKEILTVSFLASLIILCLGFVLVYRAGAFTDKYTGYKDYKFEKVSLKYPKAWEKPTQKEMDKGKSLIFLSEEIEENHYGFVLNWYEFEEEQSVEKIKELISNKYLSIDETLKVIKEQPITKKGQDGFEYVFVFNRENSDIKSKHVFFRFPSGGYDFIYEMPEEEYPDKIEQVIKILDSISFEDD